MKISLAGEDSERQRFVREAEILSTIQHPNVVPILDRSDGWIREQRSGRELAYYVTERFDVAFDAMWYLYHSPPLALRMFSDVCDAVEYLHTLPTPIIHRDLKPSNMLYGSEPRRVALADLGIAHTEDNNDGLTRTNEIVGTKYYRAPEVLMGGRGDVRSDVYSLGRTLEWLLSGRDPDSQLPRTLEHRNDISPDACEVLHSLLAKACALNAADRFASVSDLKAALPLLWADIRSRRGVTSESATPETVTTISDTPAPTDYRRIVASLRAKDPLLWRESDKRRRKLIHDSFLTWRAPHESARPRDAAATQVWIDELITAILDPLLRALALVEFPQSRPADPLDVIRDCMAIVGWNPGGLTVLVEAPESVVYAVHHLLGATALSSANLGDLLAVMSLEVRSTNDVFRPMWRSPKFVDWPMTLGDNARLAWRYIYSLSERHPWIIEIFGDDYNYHTSLVAYRWMLSFAEFAANLQEGTLAATLAANNVTLSVLPLHFLEDKDVVQRGYRHAFRDAGTVAQLAVRFGVEVAEVYKFWPSWVELLRRLTAADPSGSYMMRFFSVPGLPR